MEAAVINKLNKLITQAQKKEENAESQTWEIPLMGEDFDFEKEGFQKGNRWCIILQ